MSSTITTQMEQPLINDNPDLQSYYASLESRVGYKVFLGGTRHFGYYDHDTYWPFPISNSLRRMEDKLAEALDLPPGAYVLDAGCGVGHVALRMAEAHGLRIRAIDIVKHHVEKARRNFARSKLPKGQVSATRMDYHHLETLEKGSFDGIYTIETFVHATDPRAVLAGFYDLLRPGGHIAMHEYDHVDMKAHPSDLSSMADQVNEYSAMPMAGMADIGVFKTMLEEAGFVDVKIRDYTQNVKPMTRLFFIVAYVPYLRFFILRNTSSILLLASCLIAVLSFGATYPSRPRNLETPSKMRRLDDHRYYIESRETSNDQNEFN